MRLITKELDEDHIKIEPREKMCHGLNIWDNTFKIHSWFQMTQYSHVDIIGSAFKFHKFPFLDTRWKTDSKIWIFEYWESIR